MDVKGLGRVLSRALLISYRFFGFFKKHPLFKHLILFLVGHYFIQPTELKFTWHYSLAKSSFSKNSCFAIVSSSSTDFAGLMRSNTMQEETLTASPDKVSSWFMMSALFCSSKRILSGEKKAVTSESLLCYPFAGSPKKSWKLIGLSCSVGFWPKGRPLSLSKVRQRMWDWPKVTWQNRNSNPGLSDPSLTLSPLGHTGTADIWQ